MNLILPFLIGLAAGFIGGIATGGGLLAIPGLVFIGLPVNVAIATNNLTAVASLTSAWRYRRAGLIRLGYVLPLVFFSVIGSIIGSKLLLKVDAATLRPAFGVACLLLALVIGIDKKPKPDGGGRYRLLGPLAILLSDVFAGFFGTGGGIFVVYSLRYFYGLNLMEANASAKILAICGTVSVLSVFIRAGLIDFGVGLPLILGASIGGYLGAHTAIKKGDARIRVVFLTITLISAAKLILG